MSMHLGEVTTALKANMAVVMEAKTETAEAMAEVKTPGHAVADVPMVVVLWS